MKSKIKRALAIAGICLAVVAVWNWRLMHYGILQGIGQWNIVWNARPVDEILADPHTPDSLKQKLLLIKEVRRYAIDSLGLKNTPNYNTLFDQQGKEIMWVVTASEPYKLKEKTWHFPIVGTVPYKGYFDVARARAEKNKLESEGWDVHVSNPSGWSTLGWFKDPILSDMLYKNEGDLASLIIHEMVHATIFVKDSVNFNENLASFIGDLAALKFVTFKYGTASEEYRTFLNEDWDFRKYNAHMLRGATYLDSAYAAVEQAPDSAKKEAKETALRKIVSNMDTLALRLTKQPSKRYESKLPSNATFLSYRRYMARQMDLNSMYENQFNSDFKKMVAYFKATYPFL